MSNLTPAFSGELMLLNWKETHSGGASVTFALADAADLDLFRHMTVKKANLAGQRFAAVLVEIDENEKPVTQQLSQQAAVMCKSIGFQQFTEKKLGFAFDAPIEREQMAAKFLRATCSIESRSELDRNGRAAMSYQQLLSDYRLFSMSL